VTTTITETVGKLAFEDGYDEADNMFSVEWWADELPSGNLRKNMLVSINMTKDEIDTLKGNDKSKMYQVFGQTNRGSKNFYKAFEKSVPSVRTNMSGTVDISCNWFDVKGGERVYVENLVNISGIKMNEHDQFSLHYIPKRYYNASDVVFFGDDAEDFNVSAIKSNPSISGVTWHDISGGEINSKVVVSYEGEGTFGGQFDVSVSGIQIINGRYIRSFHDEGVLLDPKSTTVRILAESVITEKELKSLGERDTGKFTGNGLKSTRAYDSDTVTGASLEAGVNIRRQVDSFGIMPHLSSFKIIEGKDSRIHYHFNWTVIAVKPKTSDGLHMADIDTVSVIVESDTLNDNMYVIKRNDTNNMTLK